MKIQAVQDRTFPSKTKISKPGSKEKYAGTSAQDE